MISGVGIGITWVWLITRVSCRGVLLYTVDTVRWRGSDAYICSTALSAELIQSVDGGSMHGCIVRSFKTGWEDLSVLRLRKTGSRFKLCDGGSGWVGVLWRLCCEVNVQWAGRGEREEVQPASAWLYASVYPDALQ